MPTPSAVPDLVEAVRRRLAGPAPLTDVCGLPLRPRPLASEASVAASEARVGFAFPVLLRRLYVEVANGGFGPGFGILGVEGGHADDEGRSIAELHEVLRAPDPGDAAWNWPDGHLAVCDWGCGTWSVVDCTRPAAPVHFAARVTSDDADEEEVDDEDGADPVIAPAPCILWPSRPSFEAWLHAWLDGETLWHRRDAS